MSTINSQAITCKAVVCWGEGEPWKVEQIQVDPPKSMEVRVKMIMRFQSLYPRVLGHEGVGVVESVGNEVKDLREGDVVIPIYVGECKEYENCTSGITNLCLKYPLDKLKQWKC